MLLKHVKIQLNIILRGGVGWGYYHKEVKNILPEQFVKKIMQ